MHAEVARRVCRSLAVVTFWLVFLVNVIDDGCDQIVLDIELEGVDLIGGDVLEGVVQRRSQCDEHQKLQPERDPAARSGRSGGSCTANVSDGGFSRGVNVLLEERLLGPEVQRLHRTPGRTVDRPPTCGPDRTDNINVGLIKALIAFFFTNFTHIYSSNVSMVYDRVIYDSDQMFGRKDIKLFISYHVALSWICNLPMISEGGIISLIINDHANYDVFIYS